MATFAHGKLGKATVNGTDVCLRNWSLDDSAEMADVSHACSNGQKIRIPGLIDVSGTMELVWDIDAHPTSDPPDFTAGAELTTVRLYVGDPASNNFYQMDTVIVETTSVKSAVDSEVVFTVNFFKNSTTALTYPV